MSEEIIAKKDELTLSELIKKILKDTGYTRALENENTVEAENRIENLELEEDFELVDSDDEDIVDCAFQAVGEELYCSQAGIEIVAERDDVAGLHTLSVFLDIDQRDGLAGIEQAAGVDDNH